MRMGRTALMAAVLSALLSVAGGGAAWAGGGGDDNPAKPLTAKQSGQPFTEPTRMTSSNGVLTLDLVAKNGGINVAGATVKGRAYSDGIVGPTLVVNPGDTIALTLDNQLPAHTNLHFHGLHVSPSNNSDNIFLEVHPGEKFAYSLEIPADHPAGTFWYHSHAHTLSEEQVFGGLSGLIIVNGLQQLLPPGLQNIKDVGIALKDAQVVRGKIQEDNIDSNAPTLRVVNSAHLPVQTIAPGEVQLWRLANIGADIWYDLALDGQPFVVIGEDGNPVWQVHAAEDLVLPPGKRFDVLVTGGTSPSMLRTRPYNQQGDKYPAAKLMKVASGGPAVSTPAMPTALVPRADDSGERSGPAADNGVQREQQEPVLHQRQAVRSEPGRRATQTRNGGGVDAGEHQLRAASVPRPRERLPGDLELWRSGAGARSPRHRAALSGEERGDPHALHRLHGQVRLPLPHPQPRGQRHDGRRRSRPVIEVA